MQDASGLLFRLVSMSLPDFLPPRASNSFRVASAPICARSVRIQRVGSIYCALAGVAATRVPPQNVLEQADDGP